MAHVENAHEWGPIYERDGSSYRDCNDPDCNGHQEWICALDRWSDTFETPSPRARRGSAENEKPKPAESR